MVLTKGWRSLVGYIWWLFSLLGIKNRSPVWVTKHKFGLSFKNHYFYHVLFIPNSYYDFSYICTKRLKKSREGLFVQSGGKKKVLAITLLCCVLPRDTWIAFQWVSNCSKSNFVSCSHMTSWYNITDINHYWQPESN